MNLIKHLWRKTGNGEYGKGSMREFIGALSRFTLPDIGTEDRSKFANTYRGELFCTAMLLNNIGVIALGDPHPSPPKACDLCGTPWGDDAFFIDGQTTRTGPMTVHYTVIGNEQVHEHERKSKMWADMCIDCYLREGRGLGWGIGQLYRRVETDDGTNWHLIAGGNHFRQSSPTEPLQ